MLIRKLLLRVNTIEFILTISLRHQVTFIKNILAIFKSKDFLTFYRN